VAKEPSCANAAGAISIRHTHKARRRLIISVTPMENGLCLIEVPHFFESVFKEAIKKELQMQFPEVEFILSSQDKDPFIVIK